MATHFNSAQKVFTGPKKMVDFSKHTNLGDMLLENLNVNPERVMQIDGDTGETRTKADIRQRSIRMAQNLTKLGCTQNDKIAIIARNHHDLTPLLFAAIYVASPITPLDVKLSKDEIKNVLIKIKPKCIFCDDDMVECVKEAILSMNLLSRIFTVKGESPGIDSINTLMISNEDEDTFSCTKLADVNTHPAIISCSSGSTGAPKLICLSHGIFVFHLSPPREDNPLTSLCFSSLYWLTGMLTAFQPVMSSTRVFSAHPFSVDLFFDFVEKYKVGVFLVQPRYLQAILKSNRVKSAKLSSLRICVSVGGRLPLNAVQAMKELIPGCVFITTYGMTEVALSITSTREKELEDFPNSVGFLMPGIQIKIIDTKTTERCWIGEEGEIFVKIAAAPIGYYKNEKANKAAFDGEGFFRTGDTGFVDASGRLSITGRLNDFFKVYGSYVVPAEVEDIIMKLPSIREVTVVPVFDEKSATDLTAAAIVKRDGSTITECEVYKFVAEQTPSYKHLDGGVYFFDEFPLTASGKVARGKVKKMTQELFDKRPPQENVGYGIFAYCNLL